MDRIERSIHNVISDRIEAYSVIELTEIHAHGIPPRRLGKIPHICSSKQVVCLSNETHTLAEKHTLNVEYEVFVYYCLGNPLHCFSYYSNSHTRKKPCCKPAHIFLPPPFPGLLPAIDSDQYPGIKQSYRIYRNTPPYKSP